MVLTHGKWFQPVGNGFYPWEMNYQNCQFPILPFLLNVIQMPAAAGEAK